jgi:aspartate-semialdehyde dehydrogenase
LFASARSAGKRIRWRDRELIVEDAAAASYAGLDIVFFSAGQERRANSRHASREQAH